LKLGLGPQGPICPHCVVTEEHVTKLEGSKHRPGNTRTALGYSDLMRAELAASGIKGKRHLSTASQVKVRSKRAADA
jgi:hypothetical protein